MKTHNVVVVTKHGYWRGTVQSKFGRVKTARMLATMIGIDVGHVIDRTNYARAVSRCYSNEEKWGNVEVW